MMQSHIDDLNQCLEEQRAKGRRFEHMAPATLGSGRDEVEELVNVAQYVRTHPALQPDRAFAQRLEMRVRALAH